MTTNTDWLLWAACRTEDPELFFPLTEQGPGAVQVQQAKAICARCLVTSECLATALAQNDEYGVRGAVSADERCALRRDRRRRHSP